MGSVHNRDIYEMLHSMYTDSPLLQEVEEKQNRMMDCNYSKVDIDVMVADLDINDSNKRQYIYKSGLWHSIKYTFSLDL